MGRELADSWGLAVATSAGHPSRGTGVSWTLFTRVLGIYKAHAARSRKCLRVSIRAESAALHVVCLRACAFPRQKSQQVRNNFACVQEGCLPPATGYLIDQQSERRDTENQCRVALLFCSVPRHCCLFWFLAGLCLCDDISLGLSHDTLSGAQ